MILETLLITLLFSVGFNLFLFIPAFLFKTDKLTDISYALSFVAIVLFLFLKFSDQNLVHLIAISMIILWAIRLGGYLFIRINKTKTDKRFDGIRESFKKFFGFWLLQGVSVWIILIPTILLLSKNELNFSKLYLLGLSIWLIGLLIETVADYQKFKFKSLPENKDKWTDVGLWSRARHPNYFGEILVWVGIFIFVIVNQNLSIILISLISPLYIIALLLFVSGVPTIEKKYDQKYKDNPEYQKYKQKTNLIILK